MRSLVLTPNNALALVAGVAAVIFLLYLLKPRARRIVVSSNLIWNRVLAHSKSVTQRWRWLLSLLLAALIGVGIALALTQPEVRALGGEAKRVALVLDNAPSMAARTKDGASRFRHAQGVARGIVNEAGVASQFLISDTMGFAGARSYVDRATALAQIDKLPVAVSGRARFPALPTSSDLNARLERYLVSDGVAEYPVPEGVVPRSVFEPADNVALVAFEARALPNDPTRYQAFLQIFNASPTSKQVTLEVAGKSGFAAQRTVEVGAGQLSDQIVDVSQFEGGVLRASVRASADAFSIDNEAYAVVQAHHTQRVLLVTGGNRYLQDALRLLPGVQVTTVNPAKYGASAGDFDVAVFDRFAPNEAPAMPALLFRPPRSAWLPDAGVLASKPVITRWDDDNALAAGLSWKDLQLERAQLAKLPESATGEQQAVVIARGSAEGALVLASEGELRWVRLGFALEDSNLQFQSDFPVFLGSTLRWLTTSAPPQTRSIGPIEVLARDAVITDLDGQRVPTVASGTRAVFAANRPNVFTVKSAAREFSLVANVVDQSFADINSSRLADAPRSVASVRAAKSSAWHPWMLLLLAAAILVAVEALLYHRRVTL